MPGNTETTRPFLKIWVRLGYVGGVSYQVLTGGACGVGRGAVVKIARQTDNVRTSQYSGRPSFQWQSGAPGHGWGYDEGSGADILAAGPGAVFKFTRTLVGPT